MSILLRLAAIIQCDNKFVRGGREYVCTADDRIQTKVDVKINPNAEDAMKAATTIFSMKGWVVGETCLCPGCSGGFGVDPDPDEE